MDAPLHRSMDAVPASVPALRGAVAEFASAAGIGEPLLTSVKLAVSEAVTNAVVHAYAGAPRPGPVHVAAWLQGDELRVEVRDDGAGMMPRLDSPGLGVGLPFIAATADVLDIDSPPRGGTRLRMTFALEPAAARCG
ncbi:MAG TPA: ATP-binding protein [Solirubrobacteraceae bacterium]|nr:ATP-binding protein [Solirubrobacteraceae bacterium]